MANTFVNLPAPAANAAGADVDVTALGASKTIVVKGNGSVDYEPFVVIEVSLEAAAPTVWSPVCQFTTPGEKTIDVACTFMRARVTGYVQGGAPTVDVGSTDIGTQRETLVAPAGNGSGSGVDVSALGDYTTVQVSGTYKGSVNIEISNDGGTSWAQADGFSFVDNGNAQIMSTVIYADYFRVTRTGIQSLEPQPGLPVIYVAGSELGGSSSGGTVTADGTTITGDGTGGSPLTATGTLPLHNITTVVSPAALAAGATNNYAPTGLATTSILRLTPDAGGTSSLGGIVAQSNRLLMIENLGPANLTISNAAGGSAAANQFTCPGGVDFVMRAGASSIWLYDTATTKWRMLADGQGAFPYLKQLYCEGNATFDALTILYQSRVTGYFAFNSALTPAALAAGDNDNVDYTPGILAVNRIRQATDAGGSSLTGLVPIGIPGATWQLLNLGPGDLTIPNEDAGSAAANQFVTEGAVAVVIEPNGWRWITYDGTLSRWTVH